MLSVKLKEVSANFFPWAVRCLVGKEWLFGVASLVSGTDSAVGHDFFNLCIHSRPVEDISCSVLAFLDAKVRTMYDLQHLLLHGHWYDNPCSFE